MQKLYNERKNRILTAFRHEEPDTVPIITDLETWAVGYAGKRCEDVLGKPEEMFSCFGKVFEDIWFDGALLTFLTRDTRLYRSLGNAPYFYSSDGVTIQHKECCYMETEEYDELIENPMRFLTEKYLQRKFPALNSSKEESYAALRDSFGIFLEFIGMASSSAGYFEKHFGMPSIAAGIGVMPVDLIMDYFRGIRNTLADIRRRPEKVIAAAEALFMVSLMDVTKGAPELPPYPFVFFPMHIPTYLKPKQFEQIYWPTFSKMLHTVIDMGANVAMVMEGDWAHLYDFINELPKNKIAGFMDEEDLFKAKKEVGSTICIVGGHRSSMLKWGTREENLDYAKRLVDALAPGGGFMLTTSTMLLAKNEIDPENLKAVNSFVHEYGRYQHE